jgi:hypothetical protein
MNKIDAPVFVHPDALVDEGANVGSGTRVWAFVVEFSE